MFQKRFTITFRFFALCIAMLTGVVAHAQSKYDITPINGNYSFSYNQVPENLVGISMLSGTTFQWERRYTTTGSFAPISGATSATYTFSTALTQNTYYRRKASFGGNTYYSNIIRLDLVSINWENRNYIREHAVLIPGQSDWKIIDALPIGQKMQTTNYTDGLGRAIQQVAREVAAPAGSPLNTWGDMVSFSSFDALGRELKDYLPYTTVTEAGKFKTAPLTEQPLYYYNNYNENSAFAGLSYQSNPLKKVTNVKKPGTSWAASSGTTINEEFNETADDVKKFTIGYNSGDVPVLTGVYNAKSLIKNKYVDVNGKQQIEYRDFSGKPILSKVQLENSPSGSYAGWVCVYSIYDDFGNLRCRIQPEGVNWLLTNSWSFAGTNGQKIFDDLCFRYEYDSKGRVVYKKAPGAKPLYLIYDNRDRVVFTQDGNQRSKPTPEWTLNIYDELDRVVLTALYQTSKSRSTLQSDINSAAANASLTISAQGITVSTYKNPVSSTDLNNSAVTTVLKYLFYDNYTYPNVKTFNTGFDNLLAYPTGADPISPSARTLGMPTGETVRVLGTSTFLTTSVYYDENGRAIQATSENIKSGNDVTTKQYRFDGQVMSSNRKHTTASSGYTNYSIVTKNILDKIGRVTSIEKKYGSNAFKAIAGYEFDDMSRLKKKILDPSYTGIPGKTGMETLDYSYNIHGLITGINKDYALKAGGYSKWDRFFGMYLGFDNKDNAFAGGRLDGLVTGTMWNTQGDDAQRKYDFSYDNYSRLTKAVFNERATTGGAWSNAVMDFSVTGNGGKINYDLNGNLLSMTHKGVLPGSTTPVNVDDLAYVYESLSNKLLKVTDNGTLGSSNGKLNDFKDGANVADDYVYDDNGNVVVDLNKNAKELGSVTNGPGIKYNYLDKPEEIRIAGKGLIKIVYDAGGARLQKLYTPEGTSTTSTTTYINEFVYKENDLQYINFEEGRIRVTTTVSQNNGYDILNLDGNMDLPNSKRGAYDFFIRDYHGNVRMIVTEETHSGSNSCTMETGRAANEEPVFGQVDASGVPNSNNEVKARFAVSNIPGQGSGNGWTNGTIGNHVSRIGNLASSKLGPNTLLRVMAGDKVSATTIYYYQNPVTNSSGTNTVAASILSSLLQALSGSGATSSVIKDAAGNITSGLNGSVPFINATSPDAGSSAGNMPKAYLSVLFFDERFKFVEEGSATLRVQQSGNSAPALVLDNIKAPKNGYCYIYVSNESNEMVYFDNVQVAHERGRILEENHYYAYGLKIAGISSRKLADPNEGHAKNNNLFNDKEYIEEGDLDWYDYGFRFYDPQIGRFPQLDPLTDDYPQLTPYQYASCEPVANIDMDGLEKFNAIQTMAPVIVKGVKTAAKATVTGTQVIGMAAKTTIISYRMAQYSTINSDGSTSSFLEPVTGAEMPMTMQVGGQTYNYTGTENFEEITTEIVNPTVDADYGKVFAEAQAKAEFNAKFEYKQVSGHHGARLYRNGFGQEKWECVQTGLGNQDLTTDIVFNVVTLGGGLWKNAGSKLAAKTSTSLVTKYPAVAEVSGTAERTFLMPGQVIDRYGGMSGKWFSTPGTSYGARSIPPGLSPYTQFKVLKPFEVQRSLASPGMFSGQTGFGIQFQSPVGADILIKRGIIAPF